MAGVQPLAAHHVVHRVGPVDPPGDRGRKGDRPLRPVVRMLVEAPAQEAAPVAQPLGKPAAPRLEEEPGGLERSRGDHVDAGTDGPPPRGRLHLDVVHGAPVRGHESCGGVARQDSAPARSGEPRDLHFGEVQGLPRSAPPGEGQGDELQPSPLEGDLGAAVGVSWPWDRAAPWRDRRVSDIARDREGALRLAVVRLQMVIGQGPVGAESEPGVDLEIAGEQPRGDPHPLVARPPETDRAVLVDNVGQRSGRRYRKEVLPPLPVARLEGSARLEEHRRDPPLHETQRQEGAGEARAHHAHLGIGSGTARADREAAHERPGGFGQEATAAAGGARHGK